ncbi:transient receptor potential cation channel subfamily M member 3-like isoform X5 [Mytilus californianus]|uniref:transient receptor potential cation channel subfamily M member 3-like isoform X5 n=1 Tax=Mytilus californianus TaxID=6549 RepID=UPI002246554F|nr:transient receptor potential cation channel subfamily M member 3-like isoform X5 [Mytilus californianus]XP_052073402.1 transient receptor potential cation channel subfamily M member 3-like isoform X5 [Mytilus californianus]
MAGIGNRLMESKVHPSDRNLLAFGRQDFSIQSQFDTGGGTNSRMMIKRDDLDEKKAKTQERLTLEDVRFSDMRKKVPLLGRVPQSKMMASDLDDSFEQQKAEHITFIKQNFKQLECQQFVPAPNQQKIEKTEALKCHCGEVFKNHIPHEFHVSTQPGKRQVTTYRYDNLISPDLKPFIDPNNLGSKPSEKFPPVEWKADQAMKVKNTTSFGKIKFTGMEQVGGMKPAKYLRLTDEEKPDSVGLAIKLMKVHWRIMEPNTPSLIISVVGGAKNFKLNGKMRETFQSGLIKASQTTNAWLITSGFNMGVMKEVGLAVREGQSFEWYKDRFAHGLRCIGIAPWGYVKDRKVLTDHTINVEGKFDKMAEYLTSNVIEHAKPVPLNSDHTHFIFVDDGYRNSYKGVAKFRARFEKKLSDPIEKGGEGIPVVLIVVEGGRDAIDDAKTSLEQNIPVILCEGTGRAADILVYAYTNPERRTKIRKLIKKAYFELKPADKDDPKAKQKAEDGINNVFESVKSCIAKKDMISIFHINKHEELDNEILKILLKAKAGEVTEKQRLERLKLALKWDRADIAQEEIFREDALWSRGSFDETMETAILSDNVKFVQIILNQGVVMREFLTSKRLLKLYDLALNEIDINNMPLKKLITKLGMDEHKEMNMEKLSVIVVSIMDKFDYDMEEDEDIDDNATDNANDNERNKNELKHFKYPYKQLLIWSALLLRQQMANFALKMGGEPVTSTVAASRIHFSLAKYIHRNELSVKNKVLAYKEEFDELASVVLDECHSRDPTKAMMIAERRSPTWSNMTGMQMAASADNQTFLASVVCQNSISSTWKRGIGSSWQKVFIVSLFPFLAATPLLDIDKLGDNKMSPAYKFLTFITSPIAKFTYHSLMYLMFLMLFTYFVLVEFRTAHVTPIEVVCIVWISTFIIDNVYTCLAFPSPTLKGTIRDWFGLLKFLDIGNCFIAIIAFIMHLEGTKADEAKSIFCVNAVVFYIRVLEVYTVNSRLGPKMVMIKKMILELVMFILVLTIFLVAYGVVSQGLMYRQRQSDWKILTDVIYFPYWQFYGELFLDEIEEDEDCMIQVIYNMTNSTGMADWDNVTNPINITDGVPDHTYCRKPHWLVPVFLAAYLMIGNVLLLNLLIAIFSNVFQEVEVNSNRIWKYQMYLLVMEFDTKAALVPPLSIFIHIYLIFKWVFRHTCCRKAKGRQYGSRHLEYLQLFEKEQLSNYLRKKKADAKNSTEISNLSMQKRIDELYKMIKEEFLDDDPATVDRESSKARFESLYRPNTAGEATLHRQISKKGSIKETVPTDKEEEDKKEMKHRKKKRKKKAKDDEEILLKAKDDEEILLQAKDDEDKLFKAKDDEDKLLNIDKDIQKPKAEKKVADLWEENQSDEEYAMAPSLLPIAPRRKSPTKHLTMDSDSDDEKPSRSLRMNIQHDSDDNSDLNNFDRVKKKRRRRSRPQDSFSEEDLKYRGSKIRQKLRKKRSRTNDSDSN